MPLFSRLPQIRPWSDFFKAGSFSTPGDKITERIGTNLSYYSGNYLLVIAICIIFALYVTIS